MSRMNPLRPERRRRNASNLLLLTTTTPFATLLPVQAQAYYVGELGEESHPGTRAANLSCPKGKVPVGLQVQGRVVSRHHGPLLCRVHRAEDARPARICRARGR